MYWKIAAFLLGMTPALMALEVVHGPWLGHPSNGEISVHWTTDAPAGGMVEYRKAGTAEWQQKINTFAGQAFVDRTEHHVMLSGLEPGAEYEYRVVMLNGPLCDEVRPEKDKGGKFRVFSPADRESRWWITTDLQTARIHEESVPKLQKLLPPDNFDAIVIGGDSFNDFNDSRKIICDSLLKHFYPYINRIPVVALRGNHEWRGSQTEGFVRTFADPRTQHCYYMLQKGPDVFIVLDSGEDKARNPKSPYTMRNFRADYMAGQRRWLEEVVKTDAFRNARYRIIYVHNPTHATSERVPTRLMRDMLKDIADGSKPENRIHLMVAGHVHDFIYSPANGDLWCYKPGEKITKAGDWRTGKGFPYPVIVMDGPGYGGEDASVLDLRLDDTGIKAHVRSLSGVDLLKLHLKGDGTVVQEERSELLSKKEKFIKIK